MPVTVEVPETVEDVVGALGDDGAVVIAGGTQVMPRLNTEVHRDRRRWSACAARAWPGSRSRTTPPPSAPRPRSRSSARTTASPSCGPSSSRSPRRRSATSPPSAATCSSPSPTATSRSRCSRSTPRPTSPARARATRAVEELVHDGPPAGGVVTAVRFAIPQTFRYVKAMRRRLNSGSIVTVAAALTVEDGTVTAARIALGGAGDRPRRAPSAEAALIGGPLDAERAEAAGRAALDDAEPFTDAYASAWYRGRVLPVHVRRALIGEAA